MHSTNIRPIATGLSFPEGPVNLADGSILVCELAAGRVSRVDMNGNVSLVAETGGGPNGAALGPDGRCYVCNSGGFEWMSRAGLLMPAPPAHPVAGRIEAIDLQTGNVEVLFDQCDNMPLRGPNDMVFDAAGGFWFTDHGKFHKRSRDRGSVFYALPDGSSIREILSGLEGPNGIGLSPDGRRLYVAETLTARIWAYDLLAPGVLADNARTFDGRRGTLVFGMGGYCLFDSLAVDAQGNICVATLPLGICVISPDGQLLETLSMPDPFTTNLCFGGPDDRTAFVVQSATGKLLAVEDWRTGATPHFARMSAPASPSEHTAADRIPA